MSGTTTFYSFVYLRKAAEVAARAAVTAAATNQSGSNYHRISAVLFSAFTIEAHLNHVGSLLFSRWGNIERTLSWQSKLARITEKLQFEPNMDSRPFETLKGIFAFRNNIAHGKTRTHQTDYTYNVETGDFDCDLKPEWLSNYLKDSAVQSVLDDTWKIVELIHEKAGSKQAELNTISTGSFEEQ
jgi:hypothetical protein